MKVEQLNSATDGHKEVMTTSSIKTAAAYTGGNPGVMSYGGLDTRASAPLKASGWDRPDATPLTRTDGYGPASRGGRMWMQGGRF